MGQESAFEGADFIRCPNKNPTDRRDPPAQMIRRKKPHDQSPDHGADPVKNSTQSQSRKRENKILRESKDKDAHSKAGHAQNKIPSRVPDRWMTRRVKHHEKRPGCRRGIQNPQAFGSDMKDVGGKNRQKRNHSPKKHHK